MGALPLAKCMKSALLVVLFVWFFGVLYYVISPSTIGQGGWSKYSSADLEELENNLMKGIAQMEDLIEPLKRNTARSWNRVKEGNEKKSEDKGEKEVAPSKESQIKLEAPQEAIKKLDTATQEQIALNLESIRYTDIFKRGIRVITEDKQQSPGNTPAQKRQNVIDANAVLEKKMKAAFFRDSESGSSSTVSDNCGGGLIHLVMQFPLFRPNLVADEQAKAHRQTEYTHALLLNLLHPHVAQAHLILERESDSEEILKHLRSFDPSSSHLLKGMFKQINLTLLALICQ